MNDDVQYNIANLAFKNGEQLEYFHSRIIRIQQEMMLSGEDFSPTRILFQYTKEFSKSDKTRAFIVPKMTGLIDLLDNNRKYAIYTGGGINGIYRYI